MIEVAVAVSMASQAFTGIKKAVEMGRDIEDITGYFGRFFDARDAITEANQYSKNPSLAKKFLASGSVEAQALEITAAKHKMAQLEKELREYLIYTGQQNFYDDMMRERRVIRQARMMEAKRKAENKKAAIDLTIIVGCCIISFIVVMFAVALIVGR